MVCDDCGGTYELQLGRFIEGYQVCYECCAIRQSLLDEMLDDEEDYNDDTYNEDELEEGEPRPLHCVHCHTPRLWFDLVTETFVCQCEKKAIWSADHDRPFQKVNA